jgi:hypothetical protein
MRPIASSGSAAELCAEPDAPVGAAASYRRWACGLGVQYAWFKSRFLFLTPWALWEAYDMEHDNPTWA